MNNPTIAAFAALLALSSATSLGASAFAQTAQQPAAAVPGSAATTAPAAPGATPTTPGATTAAPGMPGMSMEQTGMGHGHGMGMSGGQGHPGAQGHPGSMMGDDRHKASGAQDCPAGKTPSGNPPVCQ